MASITRNASVPYSSCSLRYLRQQQVRSLSTSQSRPAQAGMASVQGNMLKNMPKQQSMASRMKKLRRSEIPTDIGIIQNTYIRPCGEMPSWFSQPAVRARLEFLYFKQSMTDFLGAIYLNRWNVDRDPLSGRRKVIPLGLRERYSVARDLHTQLYTALAEGDRSTLNRIGCSGLINEQTSRLDRARINGDRPRYWSVKYRGWVLPQKLFFTIQSLIPSFFKSIQIVADRQVQIPVGPGLVVRQVIARIDSTQTLSRADGSNPVTKKMREYFVLQKMIVDNEAEEWKIWGTVNPTDTKAAIEIAEAGKAESGTMMDRIRSVLPGLP